MKKIYIIAIIIGIIVLFFISMFVVRGIINDSSKAKTVAAGTKTVSNNATTPKQENKKEIKSEPKSESKSLIASQTSASAQESTAKAQNEQSISYTKINTVNTPSVSKNTTKIATQSNKEAGTIKYSVPSGNNLYPLSTILVTNTTGNSISQELLSKYIRSWMIVGQNNCGGICAASGTEWATPWINNLTNELIEQGFINANGREALSKNITAGQFVKTVQELDRLTINDVPFTMTQATKIIGNMLEQDGYAKPSQVTKIVFEHGSPAIYEVYTDFQPKNDKYAYWYVQANNGYAMG